ncbi:hypothetical protein Y032_0489g2370 [Ancylostoma ceylanicum]|uniref:Uncharacterized protein n=1 Tax=Ancylostoma ceylanicum TaxID=53326 RepID=A0A016WUW3_9BILA|nr:hypothetical protein Y032_0489g2370 [Ancylostoma ceylanicum]
MFYFYLFAFALLPLSTAFRPGRFVRTAEILPDDARGNSPMNQPLPPDESLTFFNEPLEQKRTRTARRINKRAKKLFCTFYRCRYV